MTAPSSLSLPPQPHITSNPRPRRRHGPLLARVLALVAAGCSAEAPIELDPVEDTGIVIDGGVLDDMGPMPDADAVDARHILDAAPADGAADGDAAELDAAIAPDAEPPDIDADVRPPGQGWRIAEGSRAFPTACGGALPLYDGELCGGDGPPCALVRAEVVDPDPRYRNAAPALAVQADGTVEMLYSVAEGGYHGHHARRTAAGWTSEPIPPALATAGLTLDGEGRAWALAYGGAPVSTTMWTWPAGAEIAGIDPLGPVPGVDARGPVSLQIDTGGCLHLATDGDLAWSRFDGDEWVRGEHTRRTSSPIAIALSPGGDVHLAGRIEIVGGWSVIWALPSGAMDGGRVIETAFPVRVDVLDPRPAHLALTPATDEMPEGVRHVFSTDGPGLRYAVRTGRNMWATTAIAHDAPLGDAGCTSGAETNAAPGDTCLNHQRSAHPYGLVASAKGDVRIIWGETHRLATLTAERFHGPPDGRDPTVWLDAGFDAVEAYTDLFVGTVVDGELLRGAPIRVNLNPLGATVVLGPDGRLHLGLYHRVGEAGFDVRAMVLGAAE